MNETLILPAFGQIAAPRVLAMDDMFAVISDLFPISAGHSLIIAKRVAPRFFDLNPQEKLRLLHWVEWSMQHLQTTLQPAPDGFNVGFNDGQAAGQTLQQFHVHVIPRYQNDVRDPRGGIRLIIPDKAKYWSD